jgi:hypothetical protein
LWIFHCDITLNYQGHISFLSDKSCERIFFFPHGGEVPLFLHGIRIVQEINFQMTRGMRSSINLYEIIQDGIYFDATNKRRIRFIHDHESGSHFFQYSIIHIAIIRENNHHILIIIQLKIIIRIILEHNLRFLNFLNLRRMQFIRSTLINIT